MPSNKLLFFIPLFISTCFFVVQSEAQRLPYPFCNPSNGQSVLISGNLNSSLPIASTLPLDSTDHNDYHNSAQAEYSISLRDIKGVFHLFTLYFYRQQVSSPMYASYVVVVVVDGFEVQNAGPPGTAERLRGIYQTTFATPTFNYDFGSGKVFEVVAAWKSTIDEINRFGTLHEVQFSFNLTATSQPTNLSSSTGRLFKPCTGAFGDFNGDGVQDKYVFRPESGEWFIRFADFPEANVIQRQWGLPGDIPFGADFTGDNIADLVVWRPSNGFWYICKSESNFQCFADGGSEAFQFGLPGDKPLLSIEGGIYRPSVYRPSEGNFYSYRQSSDTITVEATRWGLSNDIPGGAVRDE